MSYTDDAMISVLQKAEAAARSGDFPAPVHLEGTDEYHCWRVAESKKYITLDTSGRLLVFYPAGLVELDKLREVKAAKMREIERHKREKLKINLDVFAVILSIFAICFSAAALWISALNRYRPLVSV